LRINDIEVGKIKIPLKKPFKTALREVYELENMIVKITTDTDSIGYGEAAVTPVITGDTIGSIKCAITDYIKPKIIGMEVENLESIMTEIDASLVHNENAKASVDMAIYDLFGQLYGAPVFKLLGGFRNKVVTDITISVNEPEDMAKDAIEAVEKGYETLKVKVGKNPSKDLERLKAIRAAIGYDIDIRIDANQGWTPKEAVKILRKMEDDGLCIELVEQPVKASDIIGLKYVADNVEIPVLADESVFSPLDAANIIQNRAADLINIKLMKTGGIHNALKICDLAETYGIECMLGCMMESKIGLTAACHLACAKSIITRFDLDGPNLCAEDPVIGGANYDEYVITLDNKTGLGFKEINSVEYY